MKHPLLSTVEKIDGDLTGLRQDAATKYAAKTAAEKAIAEASERGEKITTESDLFVALDTAGKSYGEVADQIGEAEKVKAGLIAQMGQQGVELGGDGSSASELIDELRALAGTGVVGRGLHRSQGDRLVASDEYKAAVQAKAYERDGFGTIALGAGMDRAELRAALVTGLDSGSAGAFITPDRQGFYPLPMRPFTVLDLITIGQTDSDLVEFVRELAFTNAAAPVPEAISAADINGTTTTAVQGGQKPESAITFEVIQEAVKALAHWIPMTRRSLSDAGQVATAVDGRLRWGLGDVLERQLVNGNGAGENLRGILQTTGLNPIAAGPKSHADKIHNGIVVNRIAGYNSTGILMNPLDAETIWLSRENTGGPGTGGYLFGNPNNPGPRTLWGLPVAETPAVPQGTAIVGNLAAVILWLREGIQVLASDSHKDFFTRNIITLLAEMRAAGGIPTPQALAEVNLAAA